jgi:hypothetical protein
MSELLKVEKYERTLSIWLKRFNIKQDISVISSQFASSSTLLLFFTYQTQKHEDFLGLACRHSGSDFESSF